jgi:hypothetical protein
VSVLFDLATQVNSNAWPDWNGSVVHTRLAGVSFNVRKLINQFIGGVGWCFVGTGHRWLYLFWMALVAVLERNPKPFRLSERAVLFSVFAGAVTAGYLFLFFTDGIHRNGHYYFHDTGVQGRYLVPFCLAALLPLKLRCGTSFRPILLCGVLAVGAMYSIATLKAVVDFY